MFTQEDIGPEQRRVLDEVEMAYQEKRNLAMADQARKATPPSEFNRIGSHYNELNNRGRRIMERLADLINRLQSPSPEKVNTAGEHPSPPTPQGLIHAFLDLNETHAHHIDIMEHMVNKLEELL